MGLRSDEAVGQHFLNLDIGLQADQLLPMVRQLFAPGDGNQEMNLASVNRRGRQIDVRVVGTPLRRTSENTTGVILVMEAEEPALA